MINFTLSLYMLHILFESIWFIIKLDQNKSVCTSGSSMRPVVHIAHTEWLMAFQCA